jgi:thioredoxin 1
MSNAEFVKHADDSNFSTVVLKEEKELATEYKDKVNIVKVNVDDNPATASQYGVRSIPTLLLVRNGKVQETSIGLLSRNQLVALLDKNLN